MFAEDLLPATVRAAGARPEDGVALDVRLNWYRSLPLSCVEAIELSIDGRPVPRERLALRLAGFVGRVADLPRAIDVWWRVLESAQLIAAGSDLTSGPHDVDLGLTLRIPYYGPLADGGFVTVTDRAHGTVIR